MFEHLHKGNVHYSPTLMIFIVTLLPAKRCGGESGMGTCGAATIFVLSGEQRRRRGRKFTPLSSDSDRRPTTADDRYQILRSDRSRSRLLELAPEAWSFEGTLPHTIQRGVLLFIWRETFSVESWTGCISHQSRTLIAWHGSTEVKRQLNVCVSKFRSYKYVTARAVITPSSSG